MFLTWFIFQIFHKPGTSNHSNPLSCRADHHIGLKQDNVPKIFFLARPVNVSAVIPANLNNLREHIANASDQDITATADHSVALSHTGT
jgi:hypothetical protein